MLISITLKKMALSEQQQVWVERRIQFALGRFVARIRRVSAIFSDINGARGGVDKKCRLRISLIPSGEVVVDDVDKSVETAAANATERAARSVARMLERLRDTRPEAEQVIYVRGRRSPPEGIDG